MTDIVTPPTIDPMPPAPLPTDTPEQFNAKGFPHVAAQQTLVTQVNAANVATYQNSVAANERAVAAGESAGVAQDAASAAVPAGQAAVAAAQAAVPAASQAVAARNEAVPARDQAVAARDQAVAAAAVAGAPLVASSTTSLAVTVATKNLDVGIGKGFAPGQTVTIARTSAPATVWMRGTVLSYSSTGAGPLSVAVAEVAGSGTFTEWSISVAGARGASSLTLPVVGVSVATSGAANVFYRLDAAVALTMPANPADGDFFAFANRSGGVPTINPNGKKIKGDASILSLDTLNASACLKYDAANGDWVESFAGYTVASVSSNAILLQPNTWMAKQTFQGYTVLGDDAAPAIKTKLITGVTSASQGGSTIVSLGGVDFKKIVGLQPIVRTSVASVPPNNSNSVGYQYSCSSDSSGIGIYLSASNSGSILSAPFVVLVTYQD